MPLGECVNRHLYNKNKHGDTCPICGVVASKYKEDGKTPEEIAEMYRVPENKYVCGWLVCVEGVNRGRSYEIHPGRNFIGSADNMDIQILGDNKVDRHRHAGIAYDIKASSATLLPGEANGLVYYNGNAIYTATPIDDGETVAIGNSKFVLRLHCDDSHNWNG